MKYLSLSWLNFTRNYTHLHAVLCNPPLSFLNEVKKIKADFATAAAHWAFLVIYLPHSITPFVMQISERKVDENSHLTHCLVWKDAILTGSLLTISLTMLSKSNKTRLHCTEVENMFAPYTWLGVKTLLLTTSFLGHSNKSLLLSRTAKNHGGHQAGGNKMYKISKWSRQQKAYPSVITTLWVFKARFKWFHGGRIQLTAGSHEAATQPWG